MLLSPDTGLAPILTWLTSIPPIILFQFLFFFLQLLKGLLNIDLLNLLCFSTPHLQTSPQVSNIMQKISLLFLLPFILLPLKVFEVDVVTVVVVAV